MCGYVNDILKKGRKILVEVKKWQWMFGVKKWKEEKKLL